MPAPFHFVERVRELFFAPGPVRLPDLPKSVAFVKTDGTGILLKHHELQKRMTFLRLVHQRLAKVLSDVPQEGGKGDRAELSLKAQKPTIFRSSS